MLTKEQDAATMVGIDLATELEEEERKRLIEDKKKGRVRSGLIIKAGEGTLPSHIVTMQQAKQYQESEKRLERMGEQYGLIRGCLENIWNSEASIDEIARQSIRLFQEASQYILGGK